VIRRGGVVLGLGAALVMLPLPAGAHGLGGRSDLPVPLEYFLVGALVVLLLSFGALAVLWPEVRLQDGPRYRGRGWRPPRAIEVSAATFGVVGLLIVLGAGLVGDPDARSNAAPVTVWVLVWLLVPFLGAVLGNLWSALNPWATMSRGLGWVGEPGPGRWGVFPAATAFVAFTWLELVYPESSDPRVLGVAALIYTGYLLAWSWRQGTDRAMVSADFLTVYQRLLSSIAPIGRDPEGRCAGGVAAALPVLPGGGGSRSSSSP
jgi:hypothetical protein